MCEESSLILEDQNGNQEKIDFHEDEIGTGKIFWKILTLILMHHKWKIWDFWLSILYIYSILSVRETLQNEFSPKKVEISSQKWRISKIVLTDDRETEKIINFKCKAELKSSSSLRTSEEIGQNAVEKAELNFKNSCRPYSDLSMGGDLTLFSWKSYLFEILFEKYLR